MIRPTKSKSTACLKIEEYCDYLESVITIGETANKSLSDKISDLSMELVEAKLKANKAAKLCNNFVFFTGKCSHCNDPVCQTCGKCMNPGCKLYLCGRR